jgi:hypothetical protein
MQALLEKEIQLLNGIEKRRIEIQQEMRDLRQKRLLKECGEPVKWIGYKSNTNFSFDNLIQIFKKLLKTCRCRH